MCQYRVRTYNRHRARPEGPGGEWHVVDLGNRGTAASVKTMDIVEDLPPLGLPTE